MVVTGSLAHIYVFYDLGIWCKSKICSSLLKLWVLDCHDFSSIARVSFDLQLSSFSWSKDFGAGPDGCPKWSSLCGASMMMKNPQFKIFWRITPTCSVVLLLSTLRKQCRMISVSMIYRSKVSSSSFFFSKSLPVTKQCSSWFTTQRPGNNY